MDSTTTQPVASSEDQGNKWRTAVKARPVALPVVKPVVSAKGDAVPEAREERIVPPLQESGPSKPHAPAAIGHAEEKPRWAQRREITVTYFDNRVGRYVTNSVTLSTYVHLWGHGLLEFQQKNQPRPSFLPTREQVAQVLNGSG